MKPNLARAVLIVFTIGCAFAFSAYRAASDTEDAQIRAEIRLNATHLAAQAELELKSKFEILYGLQALFNASTHVDADEFSLAARGYLSRDRTINALEWIPEVAGPDRQRYEDEARLTQANFSFTDSKGEGHIAPAANADMYFPIYYMEPPTAYGEARGLNLASYAPTWQALQRARDEDLIVVSDVLAGSNGAAPYALIFSVLPVYKSIPRFIAERRASLQGFVAAVFESKHILQDVLSAHRHPGMLVEVNGVDRAGKPALVFSNQYIAEATVSSGFTSDVPIPVGQEEWVLSLTPAAATVDAMRGLRPYVVGFLVFLGVTAAGSVISLLLRQRMMISQAVIERTKQLNQANESLERLSNTDFLTGLANRRRFGKVARLVWTDALASGRRIGLVMIDVDHFKQYNDHFGHLAGDACLKQVAQILQHEMGDKVEMIARYGGEEFVVLLSGDAAVSNNVSRMLFAVRELQIAHAPGASKSILTISAGVAWANVTRAHAVSDLLSIADDALYQAKESGRDALVEIDVDRHEL